MTDPVNDADAPDEAARPDTAAAPGTAATPDTAAAPGTAATPGDLAPDEEELLAAFDRLRPQGSLRWAFDDAARRVDQPDLASSAGALPWPGLPDDLWERGRSARIGERFVGDVARVMADVLAADARKAADAAVSAVNGDRFVATWDALQYLAARVDALEARIDPLGLEAAEWPVPPPDQSAWEDTAASWFGDVDRGLAVVVGESGDGTIARAIDRSGRAVRRVDPRGSSMWRAFGASLDEQPDPVPDANPSPSSSIVLDEVGHHLRSTDARSVAGVVLIGCVDACDLAEKLDLLHEAIRVTVSGGTVVVLTMDRSAWDASLTNPARDLARGRPFHPETWSLLLRRYGAADPRWHRPPSGDLHAVVSRVER